MYVCTFVCVCARIFVCLCVHARLCVCVCGHAPVCVCVYVSETERERERMHMTLRNYYSVYVYVCGVYDCLIAIYLCVSVHLSNC